MEDIMTYFTSMGAVGVIAYALFKNTLQEKKEDRELFRKSVETFTDTSKAYAESITMLSVRMENVEEGVERIESKFDNFVKRKGDC